MSNQESKRWSAAEEAMKFSLNEHFLFPFFLEGLQNSRTSESEHKNFSQVRAVLLIKVCYCLYFIYYAIKPSHNSFFFFEQVDHDPISPDCNPVGQWTERKILKGSPV